MKKFDHEKLEVYKASIEFVAAANMVIQSLPRGKSYLTDQLQRAAASIPLNIAEGAGEFSPKEKARFYRMARRSATECAAIFDVCVSLELVTVEDISEPREALLKIVAMLVGLIKPKNQ